MVQGRKTVSTKSLNNKTFTKTKLAPIVPVTLMILEEKKKLKCCKSLTKKNVIKPSIASKLEHAFNLCIMKTNKFGKNVKKSTDALVSTLGKNPKTKVKIEKKEKSKLKSAKIPLNIPKFKSKQKSSQTKVLKSKNKPESFLSVVKTPKTKKNVIRKNQNVDIKNNCKAVTLTVHNRINKKTEPKKPSQTKKEKKLSSACVKNTKTVNKKLTKGKKTNANKVVIVKNKIEKPHKRKNMAVPETLVLKEVKPKVPSPKKKTSNTKKSYKLEKNLDSSISSKPIIKQKIKEITPKVKKPVVQKNKETKIDLSEKFALVPFNESFKGKRKKPSEVVESSHSGIEFAISNASKLLNRKKDIIKRPKKHREASLNALAKVHCLYENDVSSNCFKTTSIKRVNTVKSETAIILSRSHRSSAQGLRSIGHHWEMLDSSSASSSSSDDSSDHEASMQIEERKQDVIVHTPEIKDIPTIPNSDEPKPKVKRRKRDEIKMDLKDMVVKKRMASLNASAILAASYSSEKRSTVIVKTQEKVMKEKCPKKNQRRKEKEESCSELVLEKCASKKNKLSVIVEHQDSDFTITVNRSTRSTHERVCSINGMHYCISSTTSHTQTEATTVATETVLHTDHSQSAHPPQLTDSTVAFTSYTPLNALTSMTPPGANSQVVNRSFVNSAFTAPPNPAHQYRQHDYYQPAGPLICTERFHSSNPKEHLIEQSISEPVYHLPPPLPIQPQTSMYTQSYSAPYNPLHSAPQNSYQPQYLNHPYYQPQPISYPRYYPNLKENFGVQQTVSPPTYYSNYASPSHGYYHGPAQSSLYLYQQPPNPPTYSNSSPSSCYSHPQGGNPRLGLLETGYHNCPCPVQSCSKNIYSGPLIANGKGLTKNQTQTPLPPVMVALPLENSGVLGPPSPARGSTGMPPPPSPALVTARHPDNGLLTTSKLISESMQVTCDDKLKLNSLKSENYSDFSKEVPEIKNGRKRKLPTIIDKLTLKKPTISNVASHHDVKSSPGSDVENHLPVSKSFTTLKPNLRQTHNSTSQLLLKPVNLKHNGDLTLLASAESNNFMKTLTKPSEECPKHVEVNKMNNLNISDADFVKSVPIKKPKVKTLKHKKESESKTNTKSDIGIFGDKKSFLIENRQKPAVSKTIIRGTACTKTEIKNKEKKRSVSPSKHRKSVKSASVDTNVLFVDSARLCLTPKNSLKWSNGWSWEGVSFNAAVFLSSDEQPVIRKCYSAMRHMEGDIVQPRDCILLKSGSRKKDLPFIAKVGALWENPDDGEMMVSLLWYYRPEHTEQGCTYRENKDEIFASRHRDINSVACIEDKCYVLTYREYCRYRKKMRSIENNVTNFKIIVPPLDPHENGQYERIKRQPTGQVSPDRVFYCHKVYDFRTKRLLKNPC